MIFSYGGTVDTPIVLVVNGLTSPLDAFLQAISTCPLSNNTNHHRHHYRGGGSTTSPVWLESSNTCAGPDSSIITTQAALPTPSHQLSLAYHSHDPASFILTIPTIITVSVITIIPCVSLWFFAVTCALLFILLF